MGGGLLFMGGGFYFCGALSLSAFISGVLVSGGGGFTSGDILFQGELLFLGGFYFCFYFWKGFYSGRLFFGGILFEGILFYFRGLISGTVIISIFLNIISGLLTGRDFLLCELFKNVLLVVYKVCTLITEHVPGVYGNVYWLEYYYI